LQSADFLKMYTQYLNFYERAIATMNSLRENSKFQKFLSDHMEQLRGKSLMSYLIQPVQRIPRYVLLLRELKKHTPETHAEYAALSTALAKIESIAEHVNESKRQVEQASRLIDIGQRLKNSGSFVVFSPTRRLLKEGIVKKIRPEVLKSMDDIANAKQLASNDSEEQLMFLFNDVLVITDSAFYMNACVQLDVLTFQTPVSNTGAAANGSSSDSKHGSTHASSSTSTVLSLGSRHKSFTSELTFVFTSVSEKEEWHRYMLSAMNHNAELGMTHHRVASTASNGYSTPSHRRFQSSSINWNQLQQQSAANTNNAAASSPSTNSTSHANDLNDMEL